MGRNQKYTKEIVAKTLKETGWLKEKDINQHPALPSRPTIVRLFNTTNMRDVWQELNIPFKSRPSYTKEAISRELKQIGILTQREIENHPTLPSYKTILRLFNTTSLNDVWLELDIPFTPQPSYSKNAIAKELKRIGRLSTRKINKHPDLPSVATVLRLFKTSKINDVWKELNM